MNIGDRIMIQPQTFGPDMAISKSHGVCHARACYPGTVTYINRRWYRVTFDNGIRECFFFDIEPQAKAREPGNRSRLYGSVINDN